MSRFESGLFVLSLVVFAPVGALGAPDKPASALPFLAREFQSRLDGLDPAIKRLRQGFYSKEDHDSIDGLLKAVGEKAGALQEAGPELAQGDPSPAKLLAGSIERAQKESKRLLEFKGGAGNPGPEAAKPLVEALRSVQRGFSLSPDRGKALGPRFSAGGSSLGDLNKALSTGEAGEGSLMGLKLEKKVIEPALAGMGRRFQSEAANKIFDGQGQGGQWSGAAETLAVADRPLGQVEPASDIHPAKPPIPSSIGSDLRSMKNPKLNELPKEEKPETRALEGPGRTFELAVVEALSAEALPLPEALKRQAREERDRRLVARSKEFTTTYQFDPLTGKPRASSEIAHDDSGEIKSMTNTVLDPDTKEPRLSEKWYRDDAGRWLHSSKNWETKEQRDLVAGDVDWAEVDARHPERGKAPRLTGPGLYRIYKENSVTGWQIDLAGLRGLAPEARREKLSEFARGALPEELKKAQPRSIALGFHGGIDVARRPEAMAGFLEKTLREAEQEGLSPLILLDRENESYHVSLMDKDGRPKSRFIGKYWGELEAPSGGLSVYEVGDDGETGGLIEHIVGPDKSYVPHWEGDQDNKVFGTNWGPTWNTLLGARFFERRDFKEITRDPNTGQVIKIGETLSGGRWKKLYEGDTVVGTAWESVDKTAESVVALGGVAAAGAGYGLSAAQDWVNTGGEEANLEALRDYGKLSGDPSAAQRYSQSLEEARGLRKARREDLLKRVVANATLNPLVGGFSSEEEFRRKRAAQAEYYVIEAPNVMARRAVAAKNPWEKAALVAASGLTNLGLQTGKGLIYVPFGGIGAAPEAGTAARGFHRAFHATMGALGAHGAVESTLGQGGVVDAFAALNREKTPENELGLYQSFNNFTAATVPYLTPLLASKSRRGAGTADKPAAESLRPQASADQVIIRKGIELFDSKEGAAEGVPQKSVGSVRPEAEKHSEKRPSTEFVRQKAAEHRDVQMIQQAYEIYGKSYGLKETDLAEMQVLARMMREANLDKAPYVDRMFYDSVGDIPPQGIKLRVGDHAPKPGDARAALTEGRQAILGAFLDALKTPELAGKADFKIALAMKSMAGTQEGKFITIYTKDPGSAKVLMRRLDEIFAERGLTGGKLPPEDFAFGDSGLIAWRYGKFTNQREGLLVPDGKGGYKEVMDDRADAMGNVLAAKGLPGLDFWVDLARKSYRKPPAALPVGKPTAPEPSAPQARSVGSARHIAERIKAANPDGGARIAEQFIDALHTDRVTGFKNRRYAQETSEAELAKCAQIVEVDLNLKKINAISEGQGGAASAHQAGDGALKILANVIGERPEMRVIRDGGNFTILVGKGAEVDPGGLRAALEADIRAGLEKQGVAVPEGDLVRVNAQVLEVAPSRGPPRTLAAALSELDMGQGVAPDSSGAHKWSVRTPPAKPKTFKKLIEEATEPVARPKERDLLRTALEKAAYEDPMTGAKNRAWFDEKMLPMMRHTRSLIALDGDHFGLVNALWGREAGDRVIAATAKVLKRVVGPRGNVGRMGGEEFAIPTDMPAEQAARAAEAAGARIQAEVGREARISGLSLEAAEAKIQERLAKLEPEAADRLSTRWKNLKDSRQLASFLRGEMTASIGVAGVEKPPRFESETDAQRAFQEILSRADRAAENAKKAGRNRVIRYQPPPED